MHDDSVLVQPPLVLTESVPPPDEDADVPDKEADTEDFTAEYIPPEHRAVVGEATQAIHTCMATTFENVFEIGRHLIRIRDTIKHGVFRTWIEQEFGLKERKAEHLMNVYERLGIHAQLFRKSKLKPTALYHLAMPSTPTEAIDEVIKRLRAGEKLMVQQVKAIIAACKSSSARNEEADEQATITARFDKSLRRAHKALSDQTVADCERLLGADAAAQLDELRRALDAFLDQIQSGADPAPAGAMADTTPPRADAVPGQTLDEGTAADEQIRPGCTVAVKEIDTGVEACYTVVRDEPGDPDAGQIHWESPVAQALRYKRVGEIVTAQTPSGALSLLITRIDFPDGRHIALEPQDDYLRTLEADINDALNQVLGSFSFSERP